MDFNFLIEIYAMLELREPQVVIESDDRKAKSNKKAHSLGKVQLEKMSSLLQ